MLLLAFIIGSLASSLQGIYSNELACQPALFQCLPGNELTWQSVWIPWVFLHASRLFSSDFFLFESFLGIPSSLSGYFLCSFQSAVLATCRLIIFSKQLYAFVEEETTAE